MDLTMPVVVVQRSRRLVEAWVPRFPDERLLGPSLAELRDELRLLVMERFYAERPERFADYQLAPHARIEHLLVEGTVQDPHRRARWDVKARLAFLVEKWPADPFLVVTHTQLPAWRFAVDSEEHLPEAARRRVLAWCLESHIESLDRLHVKRRERLELLDVDAIAPTIFPHSPRRPRPPTRKKKPEDEKPGEKPTPEEDLEEDPELDPPEPDPIEREAQRRRSRWTVQVLREVGKNLSHAVEDDTLGRAFGRDAVVDRLVEELATREGAAVVLVGPSGVGKSAVVHEFVHRLTRWNNDHGLRRDVWRVDGNRFIAGMKYVGQWEARARELLRELTDTGDILYLDDLASMVDAGRTGKTSTNVAGFLAPHLARGELTILAESTPERLARAREEAPGFAALFRVLHLPPMSERESLPVLLGALRDLESEDTESLAPPRMAPAGIEATLALTRRFQPNEAFPGKAVRLLRAVLDGRGELREGRDGQPERRFGVGDVVAAVQQRTGLPDFVLQDALARPRESLRAEFASVIAGQPEAVDALTDLVVALQQGLCDPDKPLASFLFVGPTGVGKTESARALARMLFGSPDRMLRFDMSEFASAHSVLRLIGEPGEPDGELTAGLRTQPFTVVLFDEVEKAHPRVFDALLQLLGEGRLTDAAGRLSDARQAVLVMTSNLGVREAASQTGFARGDAAEARAHYLSAARRFFRPEFFNRIDRVVPFRPLDRPSLRAVVEHQLGALLSRRGIERAQVLVEVEPELLDVLVERAWDPRFGARPLKRAMEKRLALPLAHHLVRRSARDLSLVSLKLRSNDMNLHVRGLLECVPVPGAQVAPPGDLPAARAALEALGAALEALTTGALAERLKALAERSDAPEGAAARDVLEGFYALERRYLAVETDPVLSEEYIEEEYKEDRQDLNEPTRANYGYNRSSYRKGLRPREGFVLVKATAPPAVLLHRAREHLLPLQDALRVAEARALRVPDEDTFTLLVEPLAGAGTGPMVRSLTAALGALFYGCGTPLFEGLTPEGGAAWVEEHPQPQRACYPLRGLALAPVVESVRGFALGAVATPTGFRRSLCRVRVLPTADGLRAVERLDAERAELRRRRALGEDAPEDDVPDRVTLRSAADKPEGPWTHCLTGYGPLEASRGVGEKVHAALLRAAGG
ncbi:MAG: ATP-dependent Clp protease ATP-binding subunit [Deltaproteobacteria bacterium]|nr:ATP-dependent Clp protease ATP-binding subunit [Deltaproteobacteria bacterium]